MAVGFANDADFPSVDEVRKRWNGVYTTANFGSLDITPRRGIYAEANNLEGLQVLVRTNNDMYLYVHVNAASLMGLVLPTWHKESIGSLRHRG
ncbi:hypothetical protein J3E69DRAFT_179842 [Trichoderma sp. SZMC 28015]